MAVRLPDTAEPMGNFAGMMAKHIECDDGERLQDKIDNGSLGGGGGGYTQLSQAEYDALTEDEKMNGKEYRTYDSGHIYRLGIEYGKDSVQISDNVSEDSTWSSKKINDSLVDKQDFRIFKSLEEFNKKKGTSLTVVSGIDNMKDIVNAMSEGDMLIITTKYTTGSEIYFGLDSSTGWTKMFTFIKANGLCDVECRTTTSSTFKRVLNADGVIGDWQELATMDKVNASLGELCNKKIYCGEVTGTIVNGVISTINPIGKVGNAIATIQYSNGNPRGYSVTTQVTLSALNFYFRWHRESDGAEAYPPDGIKITISYMIFY